MKSVSRDWAAAVMATIVSMVSLSLLPAEVPVEATWEEEHREILGQITRLATATESWRHRLEAEALDPEALVHTRDTDPLDVVLRRTAALLRHFRRRAMLSPSVLGEFETRLGELSATARATRQPPSRKTLFLDACALRRRIAFSNPLLGFDDIICMLEQPGDLRIVEQARAVCSGHSRGGGPIVIRDLWSRATRVDVLSGVPVTSGPWKGKELRGKFSGLELSYDGNEVTSGAIPFNYMQLVKIPVFDKKCVPCHTEHPKAPDMSYASLARNDLAFSCPGERPALESLGVGGSRTTPGRFGARASGIIKELTTGPQHRDVELTADEWRRLTLWLDLNSNEIGWIGNDRSQISAQKRGEALWPPIDVDPSNPTGVETDIPLARTVAPDTGGW